MKYCLDTSVFIQAHRQYYAFDLAPSFWKALGEYATKGIITSPIAVYTELMDGDRNDDLKQWAKNQRDILFDDPDAKEQESLPRDS